MHQVAWCAEHLWSIYPWERMRVATTAELKSTQTLRAYKVTSFATAVTVARQTTSSSGTARWLTRLHPSL